MITRTQVIQIYKKYYNKTIPDKYKPLFTVNGFLRLFQGKFLTKEEQDDLIKYSRSMYVGDRALAGYEWKENDIENYIKTYIQLQLCYIKDYGKENLGYYQIIEGWIACLEIEIHHKANDNYKNFYDNTAYGYANMPYYLDIISYFNFDIPINDIKGFTKSEYMFYFKDYKALFPNSKHITFLKNIYDKGWTHDDFTWDENGKYDSFKNHKEYYNHETKKWEKPKTPHEYGDIHIYDLRCCLVKNGYNYKPVREIDSGQVYLEELIIQKGDTLIFDNKNPIIKLLTDLGNFYYYYGHVYCDNLKLKKISLGSKKPENLEIDKNQREFIIYNKETGYWRLPKLYYPIKFKNFIKDIIKSQKEIIGQWKDTCVYANSRTLCGNTSTFDLKNYPDIKDRNTFINVVLMNEINNYAKSLKNHLNFEGIKINIDTSNIDFDKQLKLLDCITQEDIKKYCTGSDSTYEIEYYKGF